MLKKTLLLVVVIMLGFGAMIATTRDATFAVTESRSLTAGQPAIWEALTDVEAWDEWWPGIETAQLSPGWTEGATLALTLKGRPEKTPAIVDGFNRGRQVSWTRPGVLGSTTRTLLRIERSGEGVVVSMESRLHGPQAFLARFTGEESFRNYQELVLRSLQESLVAKGTGLPGEQEGA
nr:hypothetical protein [Desulfuromonadales bacterium]